MAYVNPLVAALVNDPANPPDLVFLHGFLGPGADEAATRMYLDPTAGRFVDVRTDKIVYQQTGLAVPASPWPEDVIWLARTDAEDLREDGASLVAAAGDMTTTRVPSTPAGTVLTINVGGGAAGQPTGGDGGIGTGGKPNWHQKWP